MNGGFKLDPELAQQYINGLSTPKFTVSVPTSTPLPPGVAPDQGWATQLNAPAPTQAPQPSQADVMTALSSPGSVTAAPNYTHDQRAKQIEDADKAKVAADIQAKKANPHFAQGGADGPGGSQGFGVGLGGGGPVRKVRADVADPESRAIIEQQHKDLPIELQNQEIDQQLQLQKRQELIDNKRMDDFQARRDAKDALDRSNQATQIAQRDLDTAQKVAAQAVVDPHKFWADKGTSGTIMSAIGVALGAIGSSLSHGPNAALEMLNHAIDNDMRSQQTNLQQKNKTADNALAKLRDQTGSEEAAKQVFKIAGLQYAQSQLDSLGVGDQANALREGLQNKLNDEMKGYANYQQQTHQLQTTGGGGNGINYPEARKTALEFMGKDPNLTPGAAMQKALSMQTGQGPGLDMAGPGANSGAPVDLPSVKGTSTNWEFWRGLKGTDAHENTQRQGSYNHALESQLMQRFGPRGSSHFDNLKINETDDPKEIDRKVRDAKNILASAPVKGKGGTQAQGGGGGPVDFTQDPIDDNEP